MNPDEILKKYEDANEYHFHQLDRKWIIEAMNEYYDQAIKAAAEKIVEFYGNNGLTNTGNRIKESILKLLKL